MSSAVLRGRDWMGTAMYDVRARADTMNRPSTSPTKALVVAAHVFMLVTILNFVIFAAVATYLGGDAVNGRIEGGRYYLFGVRTENGWKKRHTEVSERVFTYSKWHAYSVIVTWPLMMAAGIGAQRLKKRAAAFGV